MARKRALSRGRYGGLFVDVDGLGELGADLTNFEKRLPMALRLSLQGDGGDTLVDEMKRRAPKGKTGELHRNIRKHNDGNDVRVGYQGELSHGNRGGGRFQKGAWIESGTRPHEIRARTRGGSLLIAGGRNVEVVQHPGSRKYKVADKSLRAVEWAMMSDVVQKLNDIPEGSRG
jgi:hypothetical protein